MYSKKYIMTPGPTEIPERIIKAITSQEAQLPAYSEIYEEDINFVKKLLNIARGEVVIMGGGATVGLEATIASLIRKQDKVLVLSSGFFGNSLAEIVKNYSSNLYVLKSDIGEVVTSEKLENFLKENPETKFIILTHCETSTGALFDLKSITKVAKRNSDAYIIVDAVSTVGGVPIDFSDIDALIFGAQKVLNMPPGLAIIVLDNQAVEAAMSSNYKGFYLNLGKWISYWKKHRYLPSTPPVNLLYGLREAIQIILEEGLPSVYRRHKEVAKALRESLKTLGVKLVVERDEYASPTVTAFYLPEGISDIEFINNVWKKYGVLFARSYGELRGKVIRVGHMGISATWDHVLMSLLSIMGTLREYGFKENIDKTLRIMNSYVLK